MIGRARCVENRSVMTALDQKQASRALHRDVRVTLGSGRHGWAGYWILLGFRRT